MRFTISIALAVLLGLASAESLRFEKERLLYEEFKRTYKKLTPNSEDDMRFAIFRHNLKQATLVQSMDQGTAEYGITKFSDLTAEEFAAKYLQGFNPITNVSHDQISIDVNAAPESIDWRPKGAVGPVLNQGGCGSCYTFSAVGNIEGQYFRKTGALLRLSQQQLVDCDVIDAGCKGGLMINAFREIKRMGGLMFDRDYPYTATQTPCALDKKRLVVPVNKWILLPDDEEQQAAYLAEHGPLANALDARFLQHYRGGVIHPRIPFCSSRTLNHAVVNVGYGTEGNKPYWILRNSWDYDFGEMGYFRMYRGEGTCGINAYVCSVVME